MADSCKQHTRAVRPHPQHTHVRARAHTHTRTHAHAHTPAHTHLCARDGVCVGLEGPHFGRLGPRPVHHEDEAPAHQVACAQGGGEEVCVCVCMCMCVCAGQQFGARGRARQGLEQCVGRQAGRQASQHLLHASGTSSATSSTTHSAV